jgi:glycosyltransferase involved in cell wall biosynthesis
VRLLYFTRDYTPHDHRFLSSLAKTEHRVYSLRLERRNQQLEDRPLPPEVQQVIWKGGRAPFRWKDFPALWLDFKRILRDVRPDLVHAGPLPNVAFLAAWSGVRPLVSMSWGSDLLLDVDHDRWQHWCARFTLQRTSVLTGDCQAVKEKAASLGFPEERVVLFPWGIDLEAFSPGPDLNFRSRRGWEDAFVLLSLRSWEPVYGVDVIVRAFAQAAEQAPELRLVLLSGGSQASLVQKIIYDHGLENRVFLGGQVTNTDLPQYYRASDLYLSASHSDGSSVSLMEALACARPVLVSDIPGNKEWITPGQEGWFFADGDVDALTQGILKAVQARTELAGMGAAARKLAERRADWSKNFLKLLEAYKMAAGVN